MGQPGRAVLEVQGLPGGDSQEGPHKHSVSRQHQTVPRWLRMSLRTALLVGLIALPTLAFKDPSFVNLTQYKGYSILFASLGAFVIPMWIPLLGDVVTAFTFVVPVGLIGIWLAFGLFSAFPNIIFMMMCCVVISSAVFFIAEWLSLPVGLLSVMPTLFIVGANTFVQMAPMAYRITVMVSALLTAAALVSTWVCALVFPEYCVDEVFRHHHEALEHLLHLTYYTMQMQPPRLVKRVYSSAAAGIGAANWKKAFRAADELPSNLQKLALGDPGFPMYREGSGLATGSSDSIASSIASPMGSMTQSRPKTFNRANIGTERSWHRVAVACAAGARAQLGASAEVVLLAAHHKRIILPCIPLVPCAKGQIDAQGLLAMRHLALSTALHIMKIFNATQPLDDGTETLLKQLQSESEWSHMRSSLLAALHSLLESFPMDYYPAGAPPNRQHLSELSEAVTALKAAWKDVAPAQQQQQQQPQQQQEAKGFDDQLTPEQTHSSMGREATEAAGTEPQGAPDGQHAAVTVLSEGQHEPEAAAAVFQEALVVEGSAAAQVLARMNTVHLIRLLQELVALLEQLYDVVEQVSEHMISCKCC